MDSVSSVKPKLKRKKKYRLNLLRRNYRTIEEGFDGSVYDVLEESDD